MPALDIKCPPCVSKRDGLVCLDVMWEPVRRKGEGARGGKEAKGRGEGGKGVAQGERMKTRTQDNLGLPAYLTTNYLASYFLLTSYCLLTT